MEGDGWAELQQLAEFYGPNAGYVLELYERYLHDPSTVDAAARAFFARWRPVPPPPAARVSRAAVAAGALPMGAPPPPPGRLVPTRGFGNVSREQQDVRDQLGYATRVERQVPATMQDFERGRMLWTRDDQPLIWVLNAGGVYLRILDTWRE